MWPNDDVEQTDEVAFTSAASANESQVDLRCETLDVQAIECSSVGYPFGPQQDIWLNVVARVACSAIFE
jgi:hypothetical protein